MSVPLWQKVLYPSDSFDENVWRSFCTHILLVGIVLVFSGLGLFDAGIILAVLIIGVRGAVQGTKCGDLSKKTVACFFLCLLAAASAFVIIPVVIGGLMRVPATFDMLTAAIDGARIAAEISCGAFGIGLGKSLLDEHT